jgi:hypothetical protein
LRRLIVARDLKMQGIDGKGNCQLFNLRELMRLDLAQLNFHRIFRIARGMRIITKHVLKEPLINSGSFSCVGKMPERRTVQIKAPIAGKAQSNRSSPSEANALGLAKIGKAYRILLSPLVGTPHPSRRRSDAAFRVGRSGAPVF